MHNAGGGALLHKALFDQCNPELWHSRGVLDYPVATVVNGRSSLELGLSLFPINPRATSNWEFWLGITNGRGWSLCACGIWGLPHPVLLSVEFCIWRFNHFHNPGLDFLHFLTCPYSICQHGFRFIQALSVLILFRKQTIMMIVNVMIDYVDS